MTYHIDTDFLSTFVTSYMTNEEAFIKLGGLRTSILPPNLYHRDCLLVTPHILDRQMCSLLNPAYLYAVDWAGKFPLIPVLYDKLRFSRTMKELASCAGRNPGIRLPVVGPNTLRDYLALK